MKIQKTGLLTYEVSGWVLEIRPMLYGHELVMSRACGDIREYSYLPTAMKAHEALAVALNRITQESCPS